MCEFVSAVATKDRLFFGPTDSHSQIIDYHKLRESGVRGVNIVKLELTPENIKDIKDPISKWEFIVDQDLLPDWWDPAKYEKRMRDAVKRSGLKGAQIKYRRAHSIASKEYRRVQKPAAEECDNIYATAYNDYTASKISIEKETKIKVAARRKYDKIRKPAIAKFEKAYAAATKVYNNARKEIANKAW